MKRLTMMGFALLALVAFGALTAGVAAAEEGLLKPETFTTEAENASKPKLEIKAGEFIQCEKVSILEATFAAGSDSHGSGVLHFNGCKANGLVAALTLGDEKEVILSQILFLICLIEPKTLVFGLFIEPTATVHIEVPALNALLLVKGGVIAENKSGNGLKKEFLLEAKGKEGTQEVAKKCVDEKGGEKAFSFVSSKDTEADKPSSETAVFNIKFKNEVELMDK